MGPLGKRIIVYTMAWILLAMVVSQIYDNIAGRRMPAARSASPTTPQLSPVQADERVALLAELQSCLAGDPNSLRCTRELADLYYASGQWAHAQVNYERAVRLDPHNVTHLLRLAGTYIYQQKFEQAVPTLQQAATLQPDSPEIHLLLGLALSRADPPQTGAAVNEWRRVIALAPGSRWAEQAEQYLREVGE